MVKSIPSSEALLPDENELSGPNVCKRLKEYSTEQIIERKTPYQERSSVWCANIPPRCTKYAIKFKTVNMTKIIKKQRVVKYCCEGYEKSLTGDGCVPICSNGCVHGVCLAPENCECSMGFTGLACDTSRCTAGYAGENCTQQCSEGKYGENCHKQCQCKNNSQCDFKTGECACAMGWTGSL